jgi:hypothetical protein
VSTEVRVYDMEDGHPCVVMVTSGTHDVSRLANLLHSGRCEDQATATYIRRTLSRHRGGRAALALLKEHGGPDLLVGTSADAPVAVETPEPKPTPIDSLATPHGTYVLVEGTVYQRTALDLKKWTQVWMRRSVPPMAVPGKRCRMKAYYEVGRLPAGAVVISEEEAKRIGPESLEAYWAKVRAVPVVAEVAS